MLLMYSCPLEWIKNSHLRNIKILFYNVLKQTFFICQCKNRQIMYSTDGFISALLQVLLLPWKPLGMLLPRVVSWLPVPQPAITVEAFDIVTVTCQGVQDYCEKSLMTETLYSFTSEHRTSLYSPCLLKISVGEIVQGIKLKVTKKVKLTLL